MNQINKYTLILFTSYLCSGSSLITDTTERGLNGYWQADDINEIVVVEGNTFRRLQFDEIFCFNASAGFLPAAGTINKNRIAGYRYSTKEEQILVTREVDSFVVSFKKIEALPKRCESYPVDTSLSNLISLSQAFSELNPVYQLPDLQPFLEQTTQLDQEIPNYSLQHEIELFDILSNLLNESKDKHAFLFSRKLERLYLVGEEAASKQGWYSWKEKKLKKLVQQENISWACNSKIGISIQEQSLNMYFIELGYWSAEALYSETGERCFENLMLNVIEEHSKGRFQEVTIDLTVNEGGSIRYANQLLNYFNKNGKNEILLEANNKALLKLEATAPVMHVAQSLKVLTSPLTASAAEHLVFGLKSIGAIQIGMPTKGVYSPVLVRGLPNGWILGLSHLNVTDKKKSLLEGVSQTPEQRIDWRQKS